VQHIYSLLQSIHRIR